VACFVVLELFSSCFFGFLFICRLSGRFNFTIFWPVLVLSIVCLRVFCWFLFYSSGGFYGFLVILDLFGFSMGF